jgi:hypothetical protein
LDSSVWSGIEPRLPDRAGDGDRLFPAGPVTYRGIPGR